MGLSRQEYWSGLPFPSLEDLPNPGNEPGSPALEAHALTSEPPGEQDAVKTGHGTTDWFQIGKGICQHCIFSPILMTVFSSCLRNAGLEEAQAGIKIAGRNINNLRYANDTTFMAESKEELDEGERGE